MKRMIALLLSVVMLLMLSSAMADEWTCPDCGKTGLISQFCPDCGAKKPEKKAVASADYKVGDNVFMGTYEQDANDKNGVEKIEWIVLSVDGDKLFLLSKKGLDRQQFNERSNGETWEGCTLRSWLNDTFIRNAFSTEEAAAIQVTSVDNSSSQGNPNWNTIRYGGNTQDKIFLLSYREMIDYVSKQDCLCEPSRWLKQKKRVFTETRNGHFTCWYWLRTSAFKNNAGVIDTRGEFETCYISHKYGVVRPALWVDASAVTK